MLLCAIYWGPAWKHREGYIKLMPTLKFMGVCTMCDEYVINIRTPPLPYFIL